MAESAPVVRRKLIEVAMPLGAINAASGREKSIRHGHPSTLHLWWARRPLATARAVLFGQLVDDPGDVEEEFATEAEQDAERARLHTLIEQLVKWESTTDETVLGAARAEIRRSWERACRDNAGHPRAAELFDAERPPPFLDPFAGGGALPLEAQRLGLEAHAGDLNPVAALINKAMIELPPRYAGQAPVSLGGDMLEREGTAEWRGAAGLAADVRHYGGWMRERAAERIGHLYPKAQVTESMAAEREDLERYAGRELTVIAWLWARTVPSPSPAYAGVQVPLASTFVLSKKKGKQAWLAPVVEGEGYRFEVRTGPPPESAVKGTKTGRASFRCMLSDVPIETSHVKAEGMAGRMGARLLAIVCEGDRERVYLPATQDHQDIAASASPTWKPEMTIAPDRRSMFTPLYGMETFGDLFTERQLSALTTFSDLVAEARSEVERDAVRAGRDPAIASAYADAIALYLSFATSKAADSTSTIAWWQSRGDFVAPTFTRHAIPMVWDFAEVNLFSDSTRNWIGNITLLAKAIEHFPATGLPGQAIQQNATEPVLKRDLSNRPASIISTDPPYYDNIGYADLSDYFYVWLRRSLGSLYPELFSTLSTPKAEEMVAAPHRHESKEAAEAFFLSGMSRALTNIRNAQHPALPATIYYAFKQKEQTSEAGVVSTGWETFLTAVIDAGFSIDGTWPVRTERPGRIIEVGANALASSIILACRPRPADAPAGTAREFAERLLAEFPGDLAHLRESNIAPVDLAQAAIGPGMRIFSSYRAVLNADGSRMSVREALGRINEALEVVLTEREGEFDGDTRWALTWYQQHGFGSADYGDAEQLSKAKNTSMDGLKDAGLVESRRGEVRLLRPSELDPEWDPRTDRRVTVWELTHHLIRRLESAGEEGASALLRLSGRSALAESARDLAYRLYGIGESANRPGDARPYNALIQSWPEIQTLSRQQQSTQPTLNVED